MATATTAAPPRLDPGVQVSSLTPPSVSSAIAQPVARPSPVLTSLAPTHVPVAVASTVQQPEQISPEPQLAAAAHKGASGSAAQEKAAAGPGSRAAEDRPSGGAPAAKRKATGRVCVECGATSTPQWREGPAGALHSAESGMGFQAAQCRACIVWVCAAAGVRFVILVPASIAIAGVTHAVCCAVPLQAPRRCAMHVACAPCDPSSERTRLRRQQRQEQQGESLWQRSPGSKARLHRLLAAAGAG